MPYDNNYGLDSNVLKYLMDKRRPPIEPTANQKNQQLAAIAGASAQLGSIGGQTADASPVQQYADRLDRQNQMQDAQLARNVKWDDQKNLAMAKLLDSYRKRAEKADKPTYKTITDETGAQTVYSRKGEGDWVTELSAKTNKPKLDDALKLRKSIESSDPGKAYESSRNASRTIRQMAQDPTAYGDLAIMFKFMKALDPTSVVREGEQALFSQSGAFTDRVGGLLYRIGTGQKITEQQRKEVMDAIEKIHENNTQSYQNYLKGHEDIAKTYGFEDSKLWDPYRMSLEQDIEFKKEQDVLKDREKQPTGYPKKLFSNDGFEATANSKEEEEFYRTRGFR